MFPGNSPKTAGVMNRNSAKPATFDIGAPTARERIQLMPSRPSISGRQKAAKPSNWKSRSLNVAPKIPAQLWATALPTVLNDGSVGR